MKRLIPALMVSLALLLGLAACRKLMPEGKYLKRRDASVERRMSTQEARRSFDHQQHSGTFAQQGVRCVDCHAFDLRLTVADGDVAEALSAHGLHRGSEACHSCHGPSEKMVAEAPGRCTTCHENLLAIVPENHNSAWQRVHGAIARAENQSCANCHSQTFCIDCHQRRDEIQTKVHERNFRFFHSVEARANPRKCGICHRPDYCSNCHEKGEVGGS